LVCFRKRYNRAEKEYIEAKTDLHEKSETKDLLTEHLYTVIHQNEMRKAKKLAELMHKLELEIAEEDADQAISPAPVPLCLITPMNRMGVQGPSSPASPPADFTPTVPTLNSTTSDASSVAKPTEIKSPAGDVPQSGGVVESVVSPVVVADSRHLESETSPCGGVEDGVTVTAASNCDAHGVPGKEIVGQNAANS